MGLGRYIPRIQRVAAQTELNIIVATGIYTYSDLPFFFHFRGPGTVFGGPELIADMFVHDIERGIADTGVKAGILKCATDDPGLDAGRRASPARHRAGASPHRRADFHAHARAQRSASISSACFEKRAWILSRVVIGHSGDTTDIAYLEELIANGSYIGMDRFGIDTILSFEDRVNDGRRNVQARPRG